MKATIRGITYDTKRDTDLRYEDVVLPSDRYETLRQTHEGAFWIHTKIPQMYKDGEWHDNPDAKEWWEYVDDQNQEPWDRVRNLDTIRPVTRDEAFRWCLEKLLPKCFRDEGERYSDKPANAATQGSCRP
jgi:hypothetical protein